MSRPTWTTGIELGPQQPLSHIVRILFEQDTVEQQRTPRRQMLCSGQGPFQIHLVVVVLVVVLVLVLVVVLVLVLVAWDNRFAYAQAPLWWRYPGVVCQLSQYAAPLIRPINVTCSPQRPFPIIW